MKYTATAINDSGAVLIELSGNNKRELIKTIRGKYIGSYKIRIDDNILEQLGVQVVEVKR